jgi:hypothetical protein
MESITCALCDRPFRCDERAIFLGVERLLLHGFCYDAAVERLDLGRVRRLEDLIAAARHVTVKFEAR